MMRPVLPTWFNKFHSSLGRSTAPYPALCFVLDSGCELFKNCYAFVITQQKGLAFLGCLVGNEMKDVIGPVFLGKSS